jgi:hypothetical protein
VSDGTAEIATPTDATSSIQETASSEARPQAGKENDGNTNAATPPTSSDAITVANLLRNVIADNGKPYIDESGVASQRTGGGFRAHYKQATLYDL